MTVLPLVSSDADVFMALSVVVYGRGSRRPNGQGVMAQTRPRPLALALSESVLYVSGES